MNEIEWSVWGIMLVLVALAFSLFILWIVDQRLLRKMFSLRLHMPSLPLWMWMVTGLSMLVGSCAMAGCLSLCLAGRAFWPAWAVILILLLLSTPRAVDVYLRSLRHTEEHRRYLLACGASHLESVIPGVRRALRAAALPLLWQRRSPVVVAMPLMFLTLLACGAAVVAALLSTLLMWAAAVSSALLSCVLALWMADHRLFDRRENLRS